MVFLRVGLGEVIGKAKKLKINVNGAALSVLCTRPGDYKEGVSP